jgi:hypothetical protein
MELPSHFLMRQLAAADFAAKQTQSPHKYGPMLVAEVIQQKEGQCAVPQQPDP